MSNDKRTTIQISRYVVLRRAVAATLVGALTALPLYGQDAPTTLPATVPTTMPAVSPTTMPSSEPAAAPPLTPAVAPPVAPVIAPEAPAPSPTRAVGNHPATTQISFNFKDASIDSVLDHLSEVAGFVVVREAPITGRVTVLSKQTVSPSEAVSLLNTVLKNQGYTVVQMGRILKVVARDKAKKENIPVHFGADPEQIEDTDELITQVIPVRSVDAVKLKTDLAPLVGADADLASNAGSNTIIITDSSSNIRRIVEIIESMDKRDATQNAIHVKQLKYADATAAAKLINDIFNPTSSTQQQFNPAQFFRGGFGRGGGGPGGFGGGGGAPQQDSDDKGNTGKVSASSDARTNTVVVTGPEDTLKVIDGVLEQLDANPAEASAFFIYRVKNGQSADMANTLNALFGNSTNGSTSTNSNTSRTGSNSTTGNRSSSGFGGGGNSSSFGGSNSSSAGSSSSISRSFNSASNGSTGNRNGSTAGGGANTAAGSANQSVIQQLQGQVNVVADTDTNSLLVATASKYQDQVKAIILELDRPVQQVLIKVLIAEVTHDNSSDLGLDFSVLNLRPSGNGQQLVSNLGNAAAQAANGGLAVSVLENNLTATFHALAVQGRLDVLSRPYILASDNQEADILVGQEYPFITDTRTTDTGQTINTVQYQDIGISLDVTPHINPDGLVILDVSPKVQNVADTSVTITTGVTSPVFNTRSADSRVGVRDGDTVVIGGLMQDQKTQTINKIPLLGDIPYLGVLFSRNNTTKTKTELLIFLTPHVVPIPALLVSMSKSETSNLKLTPSAVEPGTFQEQLHGMQLGARDATTAPALDVPPAVKPSGDALPEPQLPGDRTQQPITGDERMK